MKYQPKLTDKVERLSNNVALITSGSIQYLEVVHKSPVVNFSETAQFDVLPGGFVEAMEKVKAWRHEMKLKAERMRHHHNKDARRSAYTRAKKEAVKQEREAQKQSQIAREIYNATVVEAARQDVARVWASYGPALDEHRYRVSDFQWI